MRNLILISICACLFLHFQNKKGDVQQDTLSTKQSSIRKQTVKKAELPSLSRETSSQENFQSNNIVSEDSTIVADAELEEDDEEDFSQLPWDDIEEGWKKGLKDYLVSADPEKAEEMFNAYLEEKKKYVERIDFSESGSGEPPLSDAGEEPQSTDGDAKEGEVERMHTENLKEIFGDHYSQVETLHKEYVESVQYLNRSSVKFSISF